MHNIRLVVFDMAGTTVDEDNLVYKTVQKSLQQHGYDVTLEQVLEHGAGKEKRTAISDTLSASFSEQIPEAEIDAIFSTFKAKLAVAYDECEVFPITGSEALFEQLKAKGIAVILNTGYDSKTAQKLLSKLNWIVGQQVDGLVTADQVERGRPYPDMIHKAMSIAGVNDPSQVMKAGDSAIDIEEGKQAQCGCTVGVLSGALNREQLAEAEPDLILDSIKDLETHFA